MTVMHTEHLQHVHPIRVGAGWLVSVAVTSAAVFGFIVVGFMDGSGGTADTLWAVIAVGAGFFLGGIFTGIRTLEAPILHGVALGLTSLVAWALLNLAVTGLGGSDWSGLGTTATLVVLVMQTAAAVAGCWVGTGQARTRRGTPAAPDAD